jgi:tight adherence protein B
MISLLIGVVGSLGVFYLYTALVGWRGIALLPRVSANTPGKRSTSAQDWLSQAGIVGVTIPEFLVVETATTVLAGLLGYVVFGGFLPAIAIAVFAATAPIAAYRSRRIAMRSKAREAWPRLIEEIRVQTSSMGRSIPVALLDVGRRSPTKPMQLAFEEAAREWALTTDFTRTVSVLKSRLADASADTVCETLLVAHDLGGSDLDKRLRALLDDRMQDLEERRDAVSRQSGVRFARWFTLVVPVGMSLVGMSIGDGRDAYRTPTGQFSLLLAVLFTAGCWLWASKIMVLPETDRVLDQ